MSAAPDPPARAIATVALKGLCPRCGARTLFNGPLAFADRCRACGLDFGAFNVGDGPAAILTLVLGAIVVGVAVVIQLRYGPPMWLQGVIWTPITIAAVVGSLRVAKAALIAAEYRQAAQDGRIAP